MINKRNKRKETRLATPVEDISSLIQSIRKRDDYNSFVDRINIRVE